MYGAHPPRASGAHPYHGKARAASPRRWGGRPQAPPERTIPLSVATRLPLIASAWRMDIQTTDAVNQPTRGMGSMGTGVKAGLLALSAVALAVAMLIGLRLARPGTLPGVVVAGAEVGGLDRAQLEQRLSALNESLAADQITMTRAEPAAVEPGTSTWTARELGYRLDVRATRDRVMSRGRQPNPLSALADHFRAFGGRTLVEPVELLDDAQLTTAVDDVADALELEPVE